MTNRSASLSALMSLLDWVSPGIATTPSMVATKLATTRGSVKASGPPYHDRSDSGRSLAGGPSTSARTSSGEETGHDVVP